MLPETQEAKQELAGFINQAIEGEVKKKEINSDLKEIKDEVKRKWDITPKEFSALLKAVMNRAKVSSDADVLNEALGYVDSLSPDDEDES